MSEEKLQSVKNLIAEFGDLSLSDFRDAFQPMVADKNPAVDRYLLAELKNFRGNRGMRAVIAHGLAEREDEAYIEDFALIIEKETDVSLCKECIQGLSRIGTPDAISKLDYLAKSKPNATIASLLRKEIDKIRHEEKEPIDYYLDQLAKGNENARKCIHAAKVLLKIGNEKVVDTIIASFPNYDELARAEGAKVICQLGQPRHLENALDLLDQYNAAFEENTRFTETLENMEVQPKEERVGFLLTHLKQILPNGIEPPFEQFAKAIDDSNEAAARRVQETWLEEIRPRGTRYYSESAILIVSNQVAHAAKYHEEAARRARILHSRLRHLVAQLAHGVGKIAGTSDDQGSLHARVVDRLTTLINHSDGDIAKLALYGTAMVVRPEDEILLDAAVHCNHIDGMTRLLRTLEREQDLFTDFFLRVSLEHEILDVQEMAMHALGNGAEVYEKVRLMLVSEKPDTKRTAIRIIGEIKAEPFVDDLLALLEGQSDIIRIEAIKSIGKLGRADVLDAVVEVMYDAKSPVLIEACLQAIAAVGGAPGIERLHQFIERSRNRKNTLVALGLLVDSYRNWNNTLPEESATLVLENLKSYFEERDADMRRDSYKVAAQIITTNVDHYKTLKVLFKDANTRLRAQKSWDKSEMEYAEDRLRTVNRNFFFLQDMMEFWKEIKNRTRNTDNESSSSRVHAFERLISHLENNDRFILDQANEELLEGVVLKGLELGEASWRELNLCFKVAGFTSSEKLGETLSGMVKSVPKQAQAELLDALTKLGMSLKQISELTSIRKILVLEGSGFYRKKLCRFLRDQGYEVRDSDDPEMGEAMIRSEVPDLIISELTFNNTLVGVQLAADMLKKYGERVQWIFSTNLRDAGILSQVAKMKPKKIFFKPYPLDDLLAVIQG